MRKALRVCWFWPVRGACALAAVLATGLLVFVRSDRCGGPNAISHAEPSAEGTGTYRLAGISPEAVLPRTRVPMSGKYFPDTWGCEWSPFQEAPPPDSVMAQGRGEPPVALFALSFKSIAKSAIAPEWLPKSFDGTLYLEHGEGAYRATTAHQCKAYSRGECRIVLKGFIGTLVVIMEPVPVEMKPEMGDILGEAAERDPEEWHTPYDEGEAVPAAVRSLFAAIRDQVLAPAAHPPDSAIWQRQLKELVMTRGGVQAFYASRGPLRDPGLGLGDSTLGHSVYLWTNGRVLIVKVICDLEPCNTGLYREMQPLSVVATERPLPTGYVLRSRNEWTTPDGCLAPTRNDATHERLYLVRQHGGSYQLLLQRDLPTQQLAAALWLVAADSGISRIVETRYVPAQLSGYLARGVSRQETTKHAMGDREKCLAALEQLRNAACPAALEGTRQEVLSFMGVARSQWGLAWPHWQAVLTKPRDHEADYAAAAAAAEEDLARAGMSELKWGRAQDALQEAQKRLGVRVEPWW
jgi:hypothetical protein